MDSNQVIFKIEQLLKERHLSYNALKENTNISTTIYQWKKNDKRNETRTPSLKSIEKICEFFGISLSYFFADTDKEKLEVRQLELLEKIEKLNQNEIDAVMTLVCLLIGEDKK